MTPPPSDPGPPGRVDLAVVGSGVAGLSAALAAADAGLSVELVTKGALDEATTRWAQGGVAAVLDGDDSTELHLADTLAAGAGLCDAEAGRILVEEGPARVLELIERGARFDRDPAGDYALAREGGHSRARVLHAGGAATGAEIERALATATLGHRIGVREGWFATDLVLEHGRCVGLSVLRPDGAGGLVADRLDADAVLLACGGAGHLYAVTTNPAESTGDGVAMALRAGAAVADLEFVQFHPTALCHPSMPRPLLSEALRGHGALLLDHRGERFIDELAPRDVVARAITERMRTDGVDHVLLDARGLADFAARFPTIAASLERVGLDPTTDPVPVAPAAHYLCGGVVTDLQGATSVPGLWAAGEVACTGVHGANRLASNSLLDGLVFGARVVDAIAAGTDGPTPSGAMAPVLGAAAPIGALAAEPAPRGPVPEAARPATGDGALAALQRLMSTEVAVVRDADSLRRAAAGVAALTPTAPPATVEDHELANLVTVARAVVDAAWTRTESRGAHTRRDHPATDTRWALRLVHHAP